MKNIYKIILIALFSNIATAQIIKPSEQYFTANYSDLDNIYFKDVNGIYDKFIGTWEYTNGPYYLKIVVTKRVKQEQGVLSNGKRMVTKRQYLDEIACDYIFKYNNVTVYNLIPPYQIVNGRKLVSSINGHLINNPNQVDIGYDEPSTTTCIRSRYGSLKLTYIANSTPQLQWNRTDKVTFEPHSFCESGVFDESEYQIPANLILTKTN